MTDSDTYQWHFAAVFAAVMIATWQQQCARNVHPSVARSSRRFKPPVDSVGFLLMHYTAARSLNDTVCGVPQWWCTVTRDSRSWRVSCSALRTATWRMATSLSSLSGLCEHMPPTRRGLYMWETQPISFDVGELSTSSSRSVPLPRRVRRWSIFCT